MITIKGLPWWFSGKESTCQCKRHGFSPWVKKIPWTRKKEPIPVFSPEKSHGEEPGGLQSMGSQKVRHDGMTKYLLTHNYGQGYWEGLPSTPAEWFLECKLCQSSLVFSWSPPASSFSIFIFPSLLFLSSLETFANTHWLHSSWLGYFLY